jgi:hypothetical protein
MLLEVKSFWSLSKTSHYKINKLSYNTNCIITKLILKYWYEKRLAIWNQRIILFL